MSIIVEMVNKRSRKQRTVPKGNHVLKKWESFLSLTCMCTFTYSRAFARMDISLRPARVCANPVNSFFFCVCGGGVGGWVDLHQSCTGILRDAVSFLLFACV